MTISPAKRSADVIKGSITSLMDKKKKSSTRVQTSLLSHFTKITPNSNGDNSIMVKSSPVKGPEPLSKDDAPIKDPEPLLKEVAKTKLGKPTILPENRALLELELKNLPESWLDHLADEINKPYFLRLKEFLKGEISKGVKIFPPEDLVYSWATLCPFDQIKVIIIGQDPYHNDGQAMGLCFSVPRGVAVPPSLVNIYKELSVDITDFKTPKHGDLSYWAKQGVLLLNTALTVKAHEPASHSGRGWEQFTDAVIRTLNLQCNHLVFILWGNHAQKKSSMIDKRKHLVLTGVHPSPLSAARGFFGCKHFSKTNEYLQKNGIKPIDWQIP